MAFDIFRLDWVLIDMVIIILLLLLLFSVKIFKEISRWRFSLSNESLTRTQLKNLEIDTNVSGMILKNYSVIKNNSVREEESSRLVVFLSMRKIKRRLFRILTEGLCSYGINIIDISLKYKSGNNKDRLEQNKEETVKTVISKILNQSEQENLISCSNYIVMHYSDSPMLYKSLLSDEDDTRLISINPKISKVSISKISELTDLGSKIHLIFSKKSYFVLNNNNLKKFLKELPHYNKLGIQITIMEKTGKSYKYYETVLLGIILNIIEKKK